MKKEVKLSRKCRKGLMKKPNVIGVGIGHRQKEGQQTGDEAIVVFVDKKIPSRELSEGALVPHSLNGQLVDVIEIGEIRLLEEDEESQCSSNGVTPINKKNEPADRLKRYRPTLGGSSIGHYRVTAGTLGAVVKDRDSGQRLILSNNHVIANSSSGHDGRAKQGDDILQPGSYDGGKVPGDVLGKLERFEPMVRTFQASQCLTAKMWEKTANRMLSFFLPQYRVALQRSNEKGNMVDAALAKPIKDEDISEEILELGMPKGTADVSLGQSIVFSGRTSGVVRGKVIAKDVSLNIGMDAGEQVYFVDQLITSAVSRPGDSGSLLMDNENNAVGLLFAGSDKVSICNRIDHVCRLLNVVFT